MKALSVLFFTSFIVGFSGALMPGPLSMVAINEASHHGFWAGPLVTLGHAIAELAMVLGLAMGLGLLFKRNRVGGIIGLLGGAFLLWMGIGIAKGAWQGTIALAVEAQTAPTLAGLGMVAAGLLASIGNPYWVVWWASVGASYVVLALRSGRLGVGAFYGGHILSDLTWNSVLAFIIAAGKAMLNNDLYRGVLLACGLFLMGLSLYFIRSGWIMLRAREV